MSAERFAVLDGSSLFFRAFYALQLPPNARGIHTNAVHGFAMMLVKLLKELAPTQIVIAFDKSRTTFRTALYPDYKGTRDKTPEERADELFSYCIRHLNKGSAEEASLYRIFYYDCPPSTKVVFNPIAKRQVNLAQSDQHRWMTAFFEALMKKRKVALRRGEELSSGGEYTLRPGVLKDLCAGRRTVESLTDRDIRLNITQKGVDMRIGLDIASLAERDLVTQIILISGDSDLLPAAEYVRRRGIDFVLDPMWRKVSTSLNEHVDGIKSSARRPSK